MDEQSDLGTPIEDVNQHTDADHAANQPVSLVPFGQEPWRPEVHFSPSRMWMNDPNGMIYHNGLYHLFFQHHPNSMIWGPMHWGHATSRDLLHWEEHEIALRPDHNGTIFSGCCVNDRQNSSGLFDGPSDSNLVAVFSYDNQTQGLAISTDGGFTWSHFSGNPILPAVKPDFRDPKVIWHEPTGRWVMAISAVRECYFYTSDNLIEWNFASAFSGGCTTGIWEVPDLFPLKAPDGTTRWVLLMSINDGAPGGGSGVEYFVGDFDGQVFTWDERQGTKWLDYGPDNYAGTTWFNEPDDDVLYIGWMSNWPYANQMPTDPWRGSMTLPRKLALFDNGEGLELGGFPKAWLSASNRVDIVDLRLTREQGSSQVLDLAFLGSQTGHRLLVNFATRTLWLERPQALPSMFKRAKMDLTSNVEVSIRIIYDNGVIELFDTNSGRAISQISFGISK